MINLTGSHGDLEVCSITGFVYNADPPYSNIVRVDLDERKTWYAKHGINLPEPQPGGDVLDFAGWTKDGTRFEAIEDYRKEILFTVYGIEV